MKTFFLVLFLSCGGCFAADSVAFSRTGNTVVVTVTVDVTDILSKDASVDKKAHVLNRALQALNTAANTKTAAQLDAEAAAKKAEIDAELARLKALRPAGSL